MTRKRHSHLGVVSRVLGVTNGTYAGSIAVSDPLKGLSAEDIVEPVVWVAAAQSDDYRIQTACAVSHRVEEI